MDDRRTELERKVNKTIRGQVFRNPRLMIDVGTRINQVFKDRDTSGLKRMLDIYGVGILVLSVIASKFNQRKN